MILRVAALSMAVLAAGSAAAGGTLSTDVNASKAVVNEGQTFVISARVTNPQTTGEDVRNVAPVPELTTSVCGTLEGGVVWTTPGTGAVSLLAGPVSACTAYLAGSNGSKASHDWFWTFQAVTAGTVAFTVTASGFAFTAPNLPPFTLPTSGDTAAVTILRPAVLSATVTTSSTWFAAFGATVTVYLEVGNTGEDIAQAVRVLSITPTGTATLTPLPCPTLAVNCPFDPARAAADINPGTSVTWTWLYRLDAGGTASVFTSAAGTQYTSVLPVYSNTTATGFTIPAPLMFSLTITGPRTVIPGVPARFALRVSNLGATLARVSGLPVRLGDDTANLAGAAVELHAFGDSLLPVDFEPAPSPINERRFTVALTVTPGVPPGPYRLKADATGAERWTGTTALCWSLPLDLLVVSARSGFGPCDAVPSTLSANPWRPAAGPLRYCYIVSPEDADRRLSIRLHTLAGDSVRVLEDGARGAGVFEGAWDGTNRQGQRVAAGVYLLLYQGATVRDLRKVAVLQ